MTTPCSMQNFPERCCAALGFAVLAVICAAPARAAVVMCYPPVSSDVVMAASEIEAKKMALAQWRAKALKYGEGMDAWNIARDKSLKCFPKGDQFECVAFGSPCIIQQNPNQRPPGKDREGQSL